MKITKHEHACLVLDEGDSRLVIDPGSFTSPLVDVDRVVAIVITHEHPDHWTAEHLHRLVEANPDARILAPAGVVAAAADTGLDIETVEAGQSVTVGPFALRFFGGRHAVIHSSIPVIDNVGVLVNETLFYPGDSFTIPEGVAVDTLAVPSSAPWLKVAEVMDYVLAVAPKRSFPVHEMVHSDAGKQMANQRIQAVTEQGGGEFVPLAPGETLTV
ncbi:MAG: MBL fold metallo-hydrolase [Microbacteriaceae bacterium]